MKVTFDENGYVNGCCMIGDNGGIEVDPPDDFDTFLDRFRALTPKGRSSVEDYIAFIADRESERMSEKQSKQNKD